MMCTRSLAGLVLALAACGAPSPPPDPTADAATTTDAPDAGVKPPPCDEASSAATDLGAYEALVECLTSGPETSVEPAIEGFWRLVESRGGFPIKAGDDVVFVHRGTDTPKVAGAFTGWEPTLALTDAGRGFSHLRARLDDDALSKGVRYKLVIGRTFFADPAARRFQYDANGEFSLVRAESGRSHLERAATMGAGTPGGARKLQVYVPAGYDEGTARLPVLYMHDGQNLFDTAAANSAPASWDADAVADAEIDAGRVRPFLIVGIPNSPARFDEYTWTTDAVEGGTYGGSGAKYAAYVVNEVKPLIDARYRTDPSRASTAILGSSLGGLVSYEIALAHPDTFGLVGGMSSTFEWGRMALANETVLDRARASTTLAGGDFAFYLDSGGTTAECPTQGADNACATLEMKSILEAKGYSRYPDDPSATTITPANANILHWLEAGASHDEGAWNRRLFRAFRFFFGQR